MVIHIILILTAIILTCKIAADCYGIYLSSRTINKTVEYETVKDVNILLLIPVLRENNIIESTLTHFSALQLEGIHLIVCIAGTSRESSTMYGMRTEDVVKNWIQSHDQKCNSSLRFVYTEISETKGDRATQLNYAVSCMTKELAPDLIGVYDADSLPDVSTLLEVVDAWMKSPNTVLQQPVHFVDAANRMAAKKKNPLLVANALYQTDWTMIRELPRWYQHFKAFQTRPEKKFYRNDYLICHGEFIPYPIYREFGFPEGEVTDGIQLGYRLSMSGIAIRPLHSFCSDDVPQSIGQLIHQHKRWFGGCNRLLQSGKWCMENGKGSSFFQITDGFWSQLCWAYAAVVVMIGLFFSAFLLLQGELFLPLYFLLCTLCYCYLIPILAHRILPFKIHVRLIDWLCLPLAIALKGIGPNLYIIQRLLNLFTKKQMHYRKVER